MRFELSTVRSAVEFGFKGCEEGHNLQKVLSDFDRFMSGDTSITGSGNK